jgi:RHS repeat-associated protein
VVERYSYDVFGEPMMRDANDQILTTSDYNNPYMFTGRRYDDETGNYYYRARYYCPEIGRYLQTDPLSYIGGMNLYTYVHNDPVNRTDPRGLYEWEGPSKAAKVVCIMAKCIASIVGRGKTAAAATEAGWCNVMLTNCRVWCETDTDVKDPDGCRKKCVAEHKSCLLRSKSGKCKMKFKISG